MTTARHHRLDIYGTELHMASTKRGWNALRRINADLDGAKTLGTGLAWSTQDRDTDQQHVWIWINRDACPDQGELVDTVAHEATHVASFIFDRHQIEPAGSNGEPFAYLVGWLSAWMWRQIAVE